MISIPNFISLARLMCVPITIWLIVTNQLRAAFFVFVAAGASDAVDGFIANRFNARTTVGQYIDPLADKALLVSVYVTLGLHGAIPDWLAILVVFRDVLIIGGALMIFTLTDQTIKLEPIFVSKLNTALQILLVVDVLGALGFGFDDRGFLPILIYATAATTTASGAAYVMRWLQGTAGLDAT